MSDGDQDANDCSLELSAEGLSAAGGFQLTKDSIADPRQ
jgi:hypothetical protein